VGAWSPPGLVEGEDLFDYDYNTFASRWQSDIAVGGFGALRSECPHGNCPAPLPDDIIAAMSEPLILASNSPRRQELLRSLNLGFSVDSADVDETSLDGEAPDAMVCRLCRAKALAVAGRHPGATVLAADTVVALEGRLLGKPSDAAEAKAMLRALRDRTHQVYTAVCLATNGQLRSELSVSHVTMRPYTDEEIDAYVSSGDPLDKAGAYAIQHARFSPVARWEGCYPSIMGLPLRLAAGLLAEVGIPVRTDVAAVCGRIGGAACCAHGPHLPAACGP
jgi:septum formation protein